MRVLFPVAEAAPIYKIGGLGDVGSALPKALVKQNVDVRIVIPFHPEITFKNSEAVEETSFTITYNRQELAVTVFRTLLPQTTIPVYLINEKVYLSQHTDASDNHADKFAVFSLAVSTWVTQHSPYWQPHIIHCHDWHTALIPVILKHKLNTTNYKTLITIHNLAYQGITTTPVMQHLDIHPEACKIIQWDSSDGDLDILLEGLLHCDFITTVSPTYAKEILTDEYGEKINHILESKKSRLKGILNGLDVDEFNPQSDKFLTYKFSYKNWQQGKQSNRHDLLPSLGLPYDENKLLISFVGRVDPYQKGIGLMIQALASHQLPLPNTQFVFLGTGDPELEKRLHQAATNNPHVKIITRFDEALARKIYAASHISLIPSRFEPCGLVQLIAMRYGTLPVVRSTGGLADTVFQNKNGFLFKHYQTEEMICALKQSYDAVISDKYAQMVEAAMTADYSWDTSAKQYGMLYENLIEL